MGIVKLTDEQQQAADAAMDAVCSGRNVFVMHGLAGTGKTTVLAEIGRQLPNTLIVTLTGKAASVLRRKTGLPAQTVHSAFYVLKDKQKRQSGNERLEWRRQHDDGALAGTVVLLDECSMIPERIARDLLATGARIIACGDPGQLPPVEGEQFFSRADATLHTIHRQALESPIIRQAHAVRSGADYADDGAAFNVATPNEISEDRIRQAEAILCWTNKTRQAINRRCRQVRGLDIMPHPRPGEPVMCLRNVADLGIYNGAIYKLNKPFIEGDTAIHLDVDGDPVTVPNVNFAGLKSALPANVEATSSFDFGYALTVHKAQGSEWSDVILVDEYRRAEQRREWLYTGITRAAERLTVVR